MHTNAAVRARASRPRHHSCSKSQASMGSTFTTLRPRWVRTGPYRRSAQRVVALPRPRLPGVKWVLANQDLARVDLLATALHTEALRMESRPLRELDAPFLCAICPASAFDSVTLTWVCLTVPLALGVTGLVLVLQDSDLRTHDLAEHLSRDRGALSWAVMSSPSTSIRGCSVMLLPTSSTTRSISTMSPDTLCWRPPLRTIAYTPDSLSLNRPQATRTELSFVLMTSQPST